MRHQSAVRLLILGLSLALLASPLVAGTDVLYEGRFSPDAIRWQARPDGTVVPRLPGAAALRQTGRPLLPEVGLTLLLPPDLAPADVVVEPLETVRVKAPAPLADAAPVPTSQGAPFRWDGEETAEGGTYPARWSRYGGVQSFRGYRLAALTVFPVRVVGDPGAARPELEVLVRYRVTMRDGGARVEPPLSRLRLVPGERERVEDMLRRVVANPDALAGYPRRDGTAVAEPSSFSPDKTPSLAGSAVRYLIITSDELATAFQQLADYRTAHGLPAVVRTVEWIEANYRQGVDRQETIRMFIREAYQRWGIEYVLLGGDTDIIPARYAYSTFYPPGGYTLIPSDLYYAALDGNWNADGDDKFAEPYLSTYTPGDYADMAADVYWGRAPVSTPEQAQTFVDKVIAYENDGGGAWPDRVLFAAEVLFTFSDGSPSLDGADYAEAIYDTLLSPNGVTTVRMYESYARTDTLGNPLYPGAIPETYQAVLDSIDSGHYNIVDQIGHGYFYNMEVNNGNITVSDADNLTNDNPFILYALNCASAAFDYSCLMERFIQNPAGGSCVSIGASREAFPTTANDFQYEFFRQLYQEENTRLGHTVLESMLPWLSQASSRTFQRWTYFNYTVLGDPALLIWTRQPDQLSVSAPASLVTGDRTVAVTVTAGGQPVADATVCLSMPDGAYATGTTNAAGQVSLPVILTSPGELTLNVSAVNAEPATLAIPVTAGTSNIVVESVQLYDDGSFGSSGNGDGRPDAGETLAVFPTLKDTGGGGAVNVTATLSTTDAGITVVDPSASVGSVSPGGSGTALDPWLVRLDVDMADGTLAAFRVDATAGGDTWPSDWTMTVIAPEVEAVGLDWYDTFFGDGDGVLDPAERVALQLRLKNYGAGTASGLTARLRTDTPNVVLYDSVIVYSALDLLDEGTGQAMVSLAVVDTAGDRHAWFLVTDDQGRSFRHDFVIDPPAQPDAPTANTSLGPDIIALTWTPVDGARGYNVYRSTSQGGPWVRANSDLLEGIAYFADSGLASLTRYYYKVTAVDESLVEGQPSPVIDESTAPPEAADFPLPIAAETSAHCAVGDVNGDHRLEVIVPADEIYVFDDQGNELVDGDGDAQTIGPITGFGGDFSLMGVALADLDGVPGDEIICCDRDNALMHVLRWDGTELPGWPQSTGDHWVWATPAVGDLDGDGTLEIVANNLAAQTLVWHADGTELRDGDNNPTTNGVFAVRDTLDWAEWNRSSPALFDVDGDGQKEIIFGSRYGWNAQNHLYAYKLDGSQARGFPFETGGGGTIICSPTIADLDGDGVWEIIFVSEDDSLHALEPDGTSEYPGFPIYFRSQAVNGDVTAPSPAVGDFDDDGELEIVAVSTDKDGTGLFFGMVYLIDTDVAGGTSGQAMPGWPKYVPGNSESSPVVGDINGDGSLDIVYGIGGGNVLSPNNLYAWNADGSLVEGFPLTLGGPVRPAPVICDLEGDGDVDIVYAGWDFLVHVWDMPYPVDGTRLPWPTYRGSNVRDGVFRHPSTTGAPDLPPAPAALTLRPARPNPFNPSTRIELYVPGESGREVAVDVAVFDLLGRRVRRLASGPVEPGWHRWTWDGRDDAGRSVGAGVYFVRAGDPTGTVTRKVTLVK